MTGGKSLTKEEKDDLRNFGYDGDFKEEEDICWIHPDNQKTFEVFIALSSSWRYSPMGQIVGLDFNQAVSILTFMQITPNQELLYELKAMEKEVLDCLDKK